MLAGEDPDYAGNNDVAAAEILGYAMMLAADRKENPRDDLITKLINAHKGERGLSDDEFGYFVILLAVAGNETTRNAISPRHERVPRQPRAVGDLEARPSGDDGRRGRPVGHAGHRLPAHRDERGRGQRPHVQEGRAGRAVLRQRQLRRGASSRTRFTFNILRDPNPQLGFGGHGAHYCLGANLARQEIRVIFDALADYAPDITKLAEPVRLRHCWINGIKDLQVKYA